SGIRGRLTGGGTEIHKQVGEGCDQQADREWRIGAHVHFYAFPERIQNQRRLVIEECHQNFARIAACNLEECLPRSGFVAATIRSVNSVGLANVVLYRVVPPNAISIAIGYAWPDAFWNIALAVEHLGHAGKWIRSL